MNNQPNAPQTLEDILFSDRNKAYGAYSLRLNYEKTTRKAFFIGITFFVTALLTTVVLANVHEDRQINVVEVHLKDLIMPPPLMAQPKPETPPPAVEQQKTIQFREPKIVVDTETPNEVPDADLLNNTDAKIGPKTQDGTTEPTVIEEPAETKAAEPVEVESPDKEFIRVEVNPQFPGGTKAFIQFLQKNLHYPNSAAIAGVAGKVYLQFVIGKEGEISKLEVVKGIGFGCDQEAERVAKLMPHWIPGKQSGRAVSVRFTLPINFTLEN